MKKIKLKLDQATFEYLEVLAYGLNQEHHDGNKINDELLAGYDAKNDDFAPLVRQLLEKITLTLAEGVMNPSSWEREVVEALTGWEGTINRGMFGETVDIPAGKQSVLTET